MPRMPSIILRKLVQNMVLVKFNYGKPAATNESMHNLDGLVMV